MDYMKYTIKSGSLTEAQLEVVCNFDVKSGVRASNPDLYKEIIVGFHKGDCFHVAFNN